MGVRGLKTFLDREKQNRTIDIQNEVNEWKRKNPDQTPKIVIDFLSLTTVIARKQEDGICGGRHQITLNTWKTILNALTSTGASLVFFSDLNIQEGKLGEWMNRRDDEFRVYTEIYDSIERGITLEEITNRKNDRKSLSSTFYGMAAIAREYGQYNHSVRRECDLEIAHFAKHNNVLAVITNDTDFLIFDGDWKFWSSENICITESNRLKTIEYNRNGLACMLSLARHQLPLFATLLVNDFTHSYFHKLNRFFGPNRYRVRNVAKYVRKFGRLNITDLDLERIIFRVFGYNDEELQQVFRQSLDSYNIDFPPIQIDDALEQKLLHTNMYRPYMSNTWGIQGITMGFYDMRGTGTNFPMLLIDWIRRKKGILKPNTERDTFLVLAKKEINQNFMAHTETIICPEFPLPTLDELYLGTGNEFDEIKWKLFAWIMSLSEEIVARIKKLPRDFLLIATTVYILVKNNLIDTEEADGILYTENMVYENVALNVEYPVVLVSKHVRAAHLYNIAFSHIRQNFAIAGLLPLIQEVLQFDGVYYQKLMENVITMDTHEREVLFNSIKNYRIYANIS